MFKKIPGSLYKISLDGKMVGIDEKVCTPSIHEGKVYIEMYGQMRHLDVRWLALIAHYEVDLPESVKLRVFDITFKDVRRKLIRPNSGKQMVFSAPIVVKEKYRIVPGFTRYAISYEGEVIDLKTDKIVKVNHNSKNYPILSIRDADKGVNRDVAIHRFVALAWIKNDDVYNKTIVNHIDGVKTNYSVKNLEWVDVSGNNNHALSAGLRYDCIRTKVRDKETGKIYQFPSLAKACVFLGLGPTYFSSNNLYVRKHKLIRNRYELKVEGDETPWFFEGNDENVKASRFIIKLKWDDGREETIYGPRMFKKRFKYFNSGGDGLQMLINLAKRDYPDLQIEVQDTFEASGIQAYRLADGKIFEAETISEIARQLGLDKRYVRDELHTKFKKKTPEYLFRRKSDLPWDTDITYHVNRPWCIQAVNTIDNQELVFETLTKAAKHFNVDRSVIKIRLNTNKSFEGWIFKTQ